MAVESALVTALGYVKSTIETVASLGRMKSEIEVDRVRLEMTGLLRELQGAVLDVQQEALALQQELAAARNRVSELEAELVKARDWEGDRDNYEIEELPPASLVYVRKAAQNSTAPRIRYCAECFDSRKRSILQYQGHEGGLRVLQCPACKNRVVYRDPQDNDAPVVIPGKGRRYSDFI